MFKYNNIYVCNLVKMNLSNIYKDKSLKENIKSSNVYQTHFLCRVLVKKTLFGLKEIITEKSIPLYINEIYSNRFFCFYGEKYFTIPKSPVFVVEFKKTSDFERNSSSLIKADLETIKSYLKDHTDRMKYLEELNKYFEDSKKEYYDVLELSDYSDDYKIKKILKKNLKK